MKTRFLGKNGFNVSEVGLGCWQLGGDWGNEISEKKAFDIMQKAVEGGVTLFDTADVYGNGRSEEIIGKFLKEYKPDLRIATKFGRGSDVYPNNYTKEALTMSVEKSLKRLGVDSLDLLQLHCIPTKILKQETIFYWLKELKKEGKIKAFGASVETIDEGLFCAEQDDITSIQVIFNIFRQKITQQLLSKTKEKGVGVIARLPLASGLLSGKFTKQMLFNENDHRNYNKDGNAFNVGETFAGLPFEKGVELSDKIKNEFLPENISMAQFSQRWILDHDSISCIIPGASSVFQVDSNCSVSELKHLDKSTHKKLQEFYNNHVHNHIRGLY